MRYLCLSLLLLAGCASDYKGLSRRMIDKDCLDHILPVPLSRNWFSASVDVAGRHISGLLLVKPMEDEVYRVVFTNEAGVTFFDFEYDQSVGFTVHSIIPQLDKKPVVRLLQRDFEMILGLPVENTGWDAWQRDEELLFGARQKKQTSYFITGPDCASLQRMEVAGKRKRLVTVERFGNRAESPDSIRLRHHNFSMQIKLNKLQRI